MGSFENNKRLVDWIKFRAEQKFKGKIAIVAIYGSYVNGTANELSDIDCFFVPKTDEAYSFCADFILGGVGYDIYPINWERLEQFASLDGNLLPCLGDSKIIYADTPEDEARFMALRAEMFENLAGDKNSHESALDKYEFAYNIFTSFMPAENLRDGRAAAGFIAQFCADAVARQFHTYYHFGLKTQYRDLCAIPGVPDGIKDAYIGIARAMDCDTLTELSRSMLTETAKLLDGEFTEPEHVKNEDEVEVEIDLPGLAGLYEEISSSFNKIYHCADCGDWLLAFISAICLQNTFNEDAKPMGGGTADLLDAYDPNDLSKLALRTHEAEDKLVALIESGATIKRYSAFEDFLQADL